LIRAGIAPRHARRYAQELRDHYQDALRDELAKGAPPERAAEIAHARLGADEDLVQSLLAQPELRSMAARYPSLAFGVAPVMSWLGLAVASGLALRVASNLGVAGAPAMIDLAYVVGSAHLRVLPVLLAAAVFLVSKRVGASAHWPLVGACVVQLLAGTASLQRFRMQGQLGVSSSLLPFLFPSTSHLGPRDLGALSHGVVVGGCMLAISVLPYVALRWRDAQERDPSSPEA
jgi:hypothetical protein